MLFPQALWERHVLLSFWLVKGDIPNEKNRLLPLEVHLGVGGCGRTDSAEGAGQELDEGRISV